MYPHSTRTLFTLACLIASPAVFAQVNITVTGTIEEVVCTPTLTGTGVSGNTITLPKVNISDFPSNGSTAGATQITFTLTGCGMSTAKNNMWVHFDSPSTTSGGLMVPTSGPNRVVFEILDVNSTGVVGARVRAGGTAGDQPNSNQGTAAAFTGTWPSRDASKNYVIQYYRSSSNAFPALPGTISTSATYTVKYY